MITQEVMPEYADMGTVGIITPYRSQAEEINKVIGSDNTSTMNKYQGRECDTINKSMVDSATSQNPFVHSAQWQRYAAGHKHSPTQCLHPVQQF